jgi:hypothetical protein
VPPLDDCQVRYLTEPCSFTSLPTRPPGAPARSAAIVFSVQTSGKEIAPKWHEQDLPEAPPSTAGAGQLRPNE